MEKSHQYSNEKEHKEEEEEEVKVKVNNKMKRIYRQFEDIASSLPSIKSCASKDLICYNGSYLYPDLVVGVMAFQKLFQARDDDVILVTQPKSGTTWLKALLFSTVNRNNNNNSSNNALTTLNPHECVPFLELDLYRNYDRVPHLDSLPSPRLFSTHLPFRLLPDSVIQSGCRIVYLCRDPKDVFVSLWHFISKIREDHGVVVTEATSIEVDFDHFCKGHSGFGPFWDHMLGYWNARNKCGILFMKYEDFVTDPVAEVRRLAEFVGSPFTEEEVKDGVVEGIVDLCKFDNLKGYNCREMEEFSNVKVKNRLFYRKGVVGDWMNHLTPDMVRRLDEIIKSKFENSGLTI